MRMRSCGKSAFILLCAAGLLTACVSGRNALLLDDSFTGKALQQGGILFAGVSIPHPDKAVQLKYAMFLQQVFQQKYPQYPVVEAAKIRSSIGAQFYQQMLDSYQFHGKPRVVFMNQLQQNFPGYRYIVYAQVRQDDVRQQVLPGTSAVDVQLLTERSMLVAVHIYDLVLRQKLVWGGVLKDSAVSRAVVHGVSIENVQQNLAWYPAPPDADNLLNSILLKFAIYLPQVDP